MAVGEVLLLAVFFLRSAVRCCYSLLPLAIGMIAGALARHFLSVVTINHLTTSRVRWTVLKASLALFAERPWTGWGVGSFAAVFLERAGPLGLSSISHPHNELALWLVEGGLVGLLGALCFMASGLWLWLYGNRWHRACPVAALPVVIHMLTEYPVRQSTPHWLLLIFVASLRRLPAKRGPAAAHPGVAVARCGIDRGCCHHSIVVSHAAYATATDAGGATINTVASGRISPCGRLAACHSLPVLMSRWGIYNDINIPVMSVGWQPFAAGRLTMCVFNRTRMSPSRRSCWRYSSETAEAHRLATRFCLVYPNDRRIPWLQDARRPFNQIME